MKTQTTSPLNQKAVYEAAGKLYTQIMDGEIDAARAFVAVGALNVMNRAYALELRAVEVTGNPIKLIESGL